MLHKAFDATGPGMIGVAHQPGDFFLHVEGQAVFFAAGEVVQVTSHRPEEVLRLGETPRLPLRQDAKLDQARNVIHPVGVLGDPEQRVQVAQAALAFLDIGFQHVA